MPNTHRRRDFLRCAAWAAVAGGGVAARPAAAPAAEPVPRTVGHKFKFSLAAYSYRRLLSGERPEMTFVDFLHECARMDLEGTEPTSYYFPADVTPEDLREFKRVAFRLGLDISATSVGNDFCHPPGPQRDGQIAMVKRWIENAEILGAPALRIFAGRPRGEQTVDEAHRLVVQAIEECCEHGARHGVHLALENHGGLTATAEGTLRLCRDVASPWFGLLLDSGNFRTEDPYGDLAKIAPYAVSVHVKVVMPTPAGEMEPADLARIAGILADADYRGYISLEYEEDGDPREACPRHIEAIRAAFV